MRTERKTIMFLFFYLIFRSIIEWSNHRDYATKLLNGWKEKGYGVGGGEEGRKEERGRNGEERGGRELEGCPSRVENDMTKGGKNWFK